MVLWNLRNLGLIKQRCQETVVCVDLELRREVLQSIRLGKHGQLQVPELLSCFRGSREHGSGETLGVVGVQGTDTLIPGIWPSESRETRLGKSRRTEF